MSLDQIIQAPINLLVVIIVSFVSIIVGLLLPKKYNGNLPPFIGISAFLGAFIVLVGFVAGHGMTVLISIGIWCFILFISWALNEKSKETHFHLLEMKSQMSELRKMMDEMKGEREELNKAIIKKGELVRKLDERANNGKQNTYKN